MCLIMGVLLAEPLEQFPMTGLLGFLAMASLHAAGVSCSYITNCPLHRGQTSTWTYL